MFSFTDYLGALAYISLSMAMYFLQMMWQFIVWSAAIAFVMWTVSFLIMCVRTGAWKTNQQQRSTK